MKRTCELCGVTQDLPDSEWGCVQPAGEEFYVLACPPCQRLKPATEAPASTRLAPPEAAAPLTLSSLGQCPWDHPPHLHWVEGDEWACVVAKGQEESEKGK